MLPSSNNYQCIMYECPSYLSVVLVISSICNIYYVNKQNHIGIWMVRLQSSVQHTITLTNAENSAVCLPVSSNNHSQLHRYDGAPGCNKKLFLHKSTVSDYLHFHDIHQTQKSNNHRLVHSCANDIHMVIWMVSTCVANNHPSKCNSLRKKNITDDPSL